MNRDRPVAAEQFVFKGKDLRYRPDGVVTQRTYHLGTDSPHGCGSNSEYYVT
jgi:hypothetical protein